MEIDRGSDRTQSKPSYQQKSGDNLNLHIWNEEKLSWLGVGHKRVSENCIDWRWREMGEFSFEDSDCECELMIDG